MTDYTFTSQRKEMDSIGLMYYNARWYDLNRWVGMLVLSKAEMVARILGE
jgi:hypothetical protein